MYYLYAQKWEEPELDLKRRKLGCFIETPPRSFSLSVPNKYSKQLGFRPVLWQLIHKSDSFISWPLILHKITEFLFVSGSWVTKWNMIPIFSYYPTKALVGSASHVLHRLFNPNIPQTHPVQCPCRREWKLDQTGPLNPPAPGPYPPAGILSLH